MIRAGSTRGTCLLVAVGSLILCRSVFAIPPDTAASRNSSAPFTAWARIPPAAPAPVFTAEQIRSELASRRQRVSDRLPPGSLLMLESSEPVIYSGDTEYPFRQDDDLYYLTGLNQPGIALILLPSASEVQTILFLPRRDPAAETWTGHMLSSNEAFRTSGIENIWDRSKLLRFQQAAKKGLVYSPPAEAVFRGGGRQLSLKGLPASEGPLFTALRLFQSAQHHGVAQLYTPRRSGQRAAVAQWSGTQWRDLSSIFAELRLMKSAVEIALLRHAVEISLEAHRRSQLAAKSAHWEYELAAPIAFTFRQRNADHWAYPSVVGAGVNATTLHYETAQGPVIPGDLALIDAGAEYGHYCADVTRTFPVSGRFSPEQAAVYDIVLQAQDAALAAARPGGSLSVVHRAAVGVIKAGLQRLGLITDQQSDQWTIWFPHLTSHWLGMDVHDVGARSAPLVPGVVFTIEPGIYIRPDELQILATTSANRVFAKKIEGAFKRYSGIGVRIEDDILMTQHGPELLSGNLPRRRADIEAFLATPAS